MSASKGMVAVEKMAQAEQGSKTAWIVDDQLSMRMLMREALLGDDFSVREFSSGQAVVHACAGVNGMQLPDVLFVDVKMPGMNGFQLCEYIRQMPEGADLPILMVTGLDDHASIHEAFECGATDYISKPVNWEKFHHRLCFVLRANQAIREAKLNAARLERAERIAKLGHLDWHVEKKCIDASEQVFKMFKIEPQLPELFYDTFYQCIHYDDKMHVEVAFARSLSMGEALNVGFRVMRHDGSACHVQLQGEVHQDRYGKVDYIYATLDDITDHKRYEDMITHMAYYDEVTGIANRALFHEHLKLALYQAQRDNRQAAVIFLDLDHFKRINDTLGHHAGDRLLKVVAERLEGCVRASDTASRFTQDSSTIARLGGDEFTILLRDIEGVLAVNHVLDRIHKVMQQAVPLEAEKVYISFSMGVAIYPTDSDDGEILLKHADTAMYYSKNCGRNQSFFYAEISDPENQQNLALEHDLHNALALNELELYYQPKLDIISNRVVCFEALLRWVHPQRGVLTANDFIPMAEKNGLIIPIGEWVFTQACKQCRCWQEQGFDEISVAINLSAKQFNATNLSQRLGHIMQAEAVNPLSIVIELTESILMQDVEHAMVTLLELKDLGLHLSLDDFGTGYSSMSYLQHFPIDSLKIDKSFIDDVCESDKDACITQSIIRLAHNLGLQVVAEGVETDEQLQFLRHHACEKVQGFLFSKPMIASKATAFLEHNVSTQARVLAAVEHV
ncbi:MAG: EAL domain-containing protein [Mariprofundus sp.]|nr:EAL domain-containing protein [Mariprofundus sp.]